MKQGIVLNGRKPFETTLEANKLQVNFEQDASASVIDEGKQKIAALALLELNQHRRAEATCLKKHRELQDIKLVEKTANRAQTLHVRWVAKCTKRALEPIDEQYIDIARPQQIIIPLKKDEWARAQENMLQAEFERRERIKKENRALRDREIEKERKAALIDTWARERRTKDCTDAVFVKRHPEYSTDVKQLREWITIAKRQEQAKDDRFEAIRKRRAIAQLRGYAKTLSRKLSENAGVQKNRQTKRDEKVQTYDLHAGDEHEDLKAFDGKPLYQFTSEDILTRHFNTNVNALVFDWAKHKCLNEEIKRQVRRDRVDYAAIEKYKDDAAQYVRAMADAGMPLEAIQNVVAMTYPYAFGTLMDWIRIFQPLDVQSGPIDSIKDLFMQCKKDLVDDLKDGSVLYWIEMIIDYVYIMSTTTNKMHIVICIKRLLQEISGVSILDTLMTWIEGTCSGGGGLVTQSGENKPLQWWNSMASWISAGASAITCDMFRRFSKVIACIAALGMCRAYKTHFSLQAFERYFAATEHRKSDPISIWMAILKAIKQFCERGYAFFMGDATFADLFAPQKDVYADEMAIVLGCITSLEAGQIDRIKDTDGKLLTEEGYLVMLDRCQEKTKAMKQYASDVERRVLDQRQIELGRIQSRVVQFRNRMGLREAPFAYMLHGDSATGKTGLIPYLVRAISEKNGIFCGEESTYYMNPHDKYDTNVYPWSTHFSVSDAGTVKPEYEEGSMNDKLMRIIDNQPITALKADVDSKGKIFICPKIVSITTNVPNLDAHVKMSEPIALLRRIPVHIEVFLKKEFQQDNRSLLDSSKFKEGINDAWEFDVRQVMPLPNPMKKLPSPMGMMYHYDSEGEMKKVGVDRLVRFLCDKSAQHFEHQRKMLIGQAKIFHLKLCPHDSFVDVCFECKAIKTQCGDEYQRMRAMTELAKEYIDWPESTIPSAVIKEVRRLKADRQDTRDKIKAEMHKMIVEHNKKSYDKVIHELKRNQSWWLKQDLRKTGIVLQAGEEHSWDPQPVHNVVMTDEDAKLFANMRTKQFLLSRIIPTWAYHLAVDPWSYIQFHTLDWKQWSCVAMFLFCLLAVMRSSIVLAAVTWTMFGLIAYVAYEARKLSATIKRTSSSSLKFIGPLIANKRVVVAGCCVGLAGTIASLMVVVRMWESQKVTQAYDRGIVLGYEDGYGVGQYEARHCNKCPKIVDPNKVMCEGCLHASNVLTTQGGAASIPKDEVEKENNWLEPTLYKPRCSQKVATSTHRQVVDGMGKRMATAVFDDSPSDTAKRCNAIPYKGNVWIVPHHTIKLGFRKIRIERDSGMLNNNRTCCIGRSSWIRIPDSDLALVCLPEAGHVNDYSDFFPDEKYQGEVPVTWMFKDRDTKVVESKCVAKYAEKDFPVKDTRYVYSGYDYNLDRNTFEGMCMAPLISRGKVPHIIGFHLAGKTGVEVGVAIAVNRKMFETSYERLMNDRTNTNIQVHSEGVMKLDDPEFNIKLLGQFHDKSPFKHLEVNGTVECYGSRDGKTRKFFSKVTKSFISDAVHEITGVACTHGKPVGMNTYHPWRADAVVAVDVDNHNHDFMTQAYQDLQRKNDETMENHPEGKKYVTKLTTIEAVSGIDGCRGVDAVKPNTSAGYPQCRPKSEFIVPVLEEVPGITCPRTLNEQYQEKLKRLIRTLAGGERAYVIHQMHLKDEPTKIGKTKVRTFAGCPLEFLVAIKIYFGGILKFIMENMFEFETAVGINATSPEWTSAFEYMGKYGDRFINGDFKAFDIKSAMKLVLLSFKLMIQIAEWSGNYTKEDITVMYGLASELASPLCEYNGEFVMWYMRNLSGHGATVNINGFVNSLLMRYAYYMLWHMFRHVDSLWIQGLKRAYPHIEVMINEWIEDAAQCGGEPGDFHKAVALLTYGDDNGASVKERYGWFNHTTVAHALTSIGVTYTMADKTAMSIPYLHRRKVSFLKREFKCNDKLLVYMAPLEMASMYKTLHANIASKFVTPEQQSVEAINSVIRELFHHGRYTFDEWRANLERVITKMDMWGNWFDRRLPTYDELEGQYIQKYRLITSDPSAVIAKNGLRTLEYDSDGCEVPSVEEYACTDEGVS